MKREINSESLKQFIDENFKSKTAFMRESGIAPSHLYKLFNEEVSVGDKTYKKLEKLANNADWDVRDFIKDEEFEIGGGKCRAIAIANKNGDLIALLMKDKIVIDKNYDYFLQK